MCLAVGIATNFFVGRFVDGLPVNEVPAPPLKMCEVHGAVMLLDHVPVKYGLRVATIPRLEAEQELFPNSNHFVDGNCGHDIGKDALVYFCPLCRAAQAEREQKDGDHAETFWEPCGRVDSFKFVR
jgi:hypothetical protein